MLVIAVVLAEKILTIWQRFTETILVPKFPSIRLLYQGQKFENSTIHVDSIVLLE